MVTRADMGRLKSRLRTPNDFRWIIEGLPVVAQFSQAGRKQLEDLGHFPGHNNNSDTLKIWVGVSEEATESLVTLAIRLNVGADRRKRKKARSKGRLMFLVVPTESLSLGIRQTFYDELNNHEGLRKLMDVPSDAKSGDCTVLDLSIDIQAAKSRVIMMKEPLGHPLLPQSLLLLRKLKCLSEASAFHLFANHDQNVQSPIEYLQAILQQSATSWKTPEFDLQKLFAGDCSGAFDTWADQGWTRGEEDTSSRVDRDCSWPSSPPPAYVPKLSRDFPHTAQNGYHHLGHHDTLSPSRTPHPPLLPTEQILSSNYTADLLVGLTADSKTQMSDSLKDKNVTHETSLKTHFVVPQTLSRVSHYSFASERSLVGSSSSGIVLDTPTRKRPLHPTTESIGEGDTKRLNFASLSGPQYGVHSPLNRNLYRGVMCQAVTSQSPTQAHTVLPPTSPWSVVQSGSNTSATPLESATLLDTLAIMPSVSYHQRMTLWLVRTWKLFPSAHYKFIAELLRLGDAAQQDDARAFHDSLVASTVAATEYCAQENVHTSTACASISITEEHARHTLRSLASWLHILDSRAELDSLPDLVRFSSLQRKVLDLPAKHGAEYDDLINTCTQLRANIVSNACIQLAHQVLGKGEQDERDILLQMSQEEARLKLE